MPSNSREINLGADRGAFYSAFYCARRGPLTERLEFEYRDGLAAEPFLQSFSLKTAIESEPSA